MNGGHRNAGYDEAGSDAFRHLVEQAPAGVCIHRGGRFLYANQALADLLGYDSVEDLLSLDSLSEIVAPEDRERLRRQIKTGAAGDDEPTGFEYLSRRKDGSALYLRNQSRPVDWDGGPATLIVVTDVDRYRRVEQVVRESELQYRSLFDNAPEAILVYDVDANGFIDANDNAVQLLGYPRETLLTLDPTAFYPERERATGEPAKQVRRRMTDALLGNVLEYQRDFRDARGREFLCEVRLSRLPALGKRLVVSRIADISERQAVERALRESQRLFESIMATIPDLMIVFDADGVYRNVFSGDLAQLTDAPEDLIGRSLREVHSEAFAAAVEGVLREALESDSVHSIEYEIEIRGVEHWFAANAARVPLEGDNGVLWVARDITQRKKVEEALRLSERRLRQVIDLVPHMIFARDREGRYLFVNQAVADFYGKSTDAIVGRRHAEMTGSGNSAGDTLVRDQDVIETGLSNTHARQRLVDASGNWRVVQTTKIPFSASGSEGSAVLGISIDVGEREWAESVVRIQSRMLEMVTTGEGLDAILSQLCRDVEGMVPDARCLVFAPDAPLSSPVVAPTVDSDMADAFHRIQARIGSPSDEDPAESGVRLVLDASRDPVWSDLCTRGGDFDVHACWSVAAFSDAQHEVGRIVLLRAVAEAPGGNDLHLLASAAQLAGIAIEHRRSERAHRESEARFRDFAAIAADWFWETDAESRFTYLSGRYEEVMGVGLDVFLGKTSEELVDPEGLAGDFWARHRADVAARRPFDALELDWQRPDGETRVVRLNGHPVFEQSGEFRGYRGVGSDVTAAHNLSKQLSHEVSHDSLTGLVNRREFERRLDRVLATARDHETEHALCYLDLDQFKVVNDTSGHVAGDELLRQLGAVLRGQVRKRDTLARLGGDEFGVLVEHCTLREAQRVAETLLHAIEDFRFSWEDKGFSLGVSIGLVPINAGSGTMTDVLRQADSACYVAKDLGRSRIHLYQPDDEALARQQGEIQWVSRINTALVEDRFALTCQQIRPIGDTADTRLHCELLLRMVEADGSLISPGSFLPAAERFNLATRLDRWVVKHAFGWLRDNPRLVDRLGLCSINLSGQSVGDGDFLGFVSDLLVSHSVPTDRICFEITETAAVANLTAASQFINSLRAKGCQFALDDFGSGLSSFNYLKHLPVDYLKIDGVFVRDIVTDPVDLAMVRSINEMGHVLGKRTIAEFVEDQPILDRLRELGVDYAQGYHIGRPRPLSDFD